jgi:DNA invertase Pin-like site-specific DNA recombinase
MKKQAYAYLRVSTSGQLAGYGPERQEELIRVFAKRAGYSIAEVYFDAYTGTEADRPRFTAMLAAMMDNGIKTVIVESLDRLARNLHIQNLLLAKLSAEELTLLAANTGEDVTAAMKDDPMRWAMVQIQGIFSQLDHDLLVNKLRKGREAVRAETGRCGGPLPFGSKDGEQATVDRIRKLHRQRASLQRIATTLNAEDRKTRMGRAWSKMTVKAVVDRLGKAGGR